VLIKQPIVKMHDQGDFLLVTEKQLFLGYYYAPTSHNRLNELELLVDWIRGLAR
jgi:hypothetical protein